MRGFDMWLLLLFLLCAAPAWAEPGLELRYERDDNIFNPAARYASDKPLNPANRYDPGNPLNPANRYNPNVPFEPLNQPLRSNR